MGKNDTPPRRGIAFECIFRSLGTSYNLLRIDINNIRGIITDAIRTEMMKVKMTKKYSKMSVI